MKKTILLFLIIITISINVSLTAQVSDKAKQQIYKDVSGLIYKYETGRPEVLTPAELVSRSQARSKITQAVNDNPDLALKYFDVYTAILDTLVFTNPPAAKEVLDNLSVWFNKIQSVKEKLDFYQGAIEFHQGYYNNAISTFNGFLKQYPYSVMASDAYTLLLKAYITSNQEKEAYTILESISRTLTDEQYFLAGNICFVLDKDALAEYYFKQIKSGKYKDDSVLMLDMLAALQGDPTDAKTRFEELNQATPSNPFVILSLARLSCLLGEWSDADMFYTQYLTAMKSYKEFQIEYERATLYLNTRNEDKALDVMNKAIVSPELGSYVCPFLYLWSEVTTSRGSATEASTRTDEIISKVQENDRIISAKKELVHSIDSLRDNLGSKPKTELINSTIQALGIVSGKLDSLNATLDKQPYGIASETQLSIKKTENQVILRFNELLNDYLVADQLRNIPDTERIKQLDALVVIYKNQLDRLAAIRAAAMKISEQNTFLAIRNEIDSNIEILDNILGSLYNLKNNSQSIKGIAKIDSLIVTSERKKAETALLLDYYDYDNSEYKAIMNEVRLSEEETVKLIASIDLTKTAFQENYPKYVSNREKRLIAQGINNLQILVPAYEDLLISQQDYLRSVKTVLDYNKVHISYVETTYLDRNKASQENKLSFEENQKLFVANQARKQLVYNQLQSYIDKYGKSYEAKYAQASPGFNIMGSAYFTLAELGSSLEPGSMEKNLDLFRKVLETDSKFYMTDAVLYNIGYLSSTLTKSKVEDAILNYSYSDNEATIRPISLRYTEDNYREAIEAYQAIADNYKGSNYYSEALFRLGYIYFEIGTDATRPVEYYNIARTYYDKIISQQDNPYRYKALYQRGWTWLNSSSETAYKSAIDDFVSILKSIEKHELTDSTEVVDYSIASVKNIGYCLMGLDGSDTVSEAKGAIYAKDYLAKQINPENMDKVLIEAASQKLKLYSPMQATDFMQTRIVLNGKSLENPIIADSICTLYKMYPSQMKRDLPADSLYLHERESIVRDYGYDSQWYAANSNKNIDKQMLIIRKSYADIEKRYNNLFVENPTPDNFKKYISITGQYQQMESRSSKPDLQWLNETETNIIAQNLRLAQVTGNPKYYFELQDRIYKYNEKSPSNEMLLNLEGTAYDCARIICDSLKVSPTDYKNRNAGFNLPISDTNPSDYYRQSAERFIRFLQIDKFKSASNDKLYISVVSRQAELAREQKNYDVSNDYYMRIADYKGDLPSDIRRNTYINIADNYEAVKNYRQAEKWYKQAEEYALSKQDKLVIHQYYLLQIQNSIDQAKTQGNNSQMGDDYLRLADEYALTDPSKNIQYKGKAQIAYQDAGDYVKSITLLSDIAKTKKNPTDVFNLYRLAWTLADSVGMGSKSDSLKTEFIQLYPSSSEAYQVKLAMIDSKASETSTSKQAGDMYLSLYDDINSMKVTPGKDDPAEVLLAAITMYDKAGDETEKEKQAEVFIGKYPNHSATNSLMEYLADRRKAKGDIAGYENISRQLFERDKANQVRYANISKDKLRKIADEFNSAYNVKDWNTVKSKIAEFKALHAVYKKEGLNLDFEPVYQSFTQAETEYKNLQAKSVFDAKFNQTIVEVEQGFLKQKPETLVRVNLYTKWKKNLIGGDNRIQYLKYTTGQEIKKIRGLLEEGVKYDLSVENRLKGLNTICRIADHAAEALNIQIDKYMSISNEFAAYKHQFKNAIEELNAGINEQRTSHINSILQLALPYNLAIYRYYYLPGIRNSYTIAAFDRLSKLNALPDYKMEQIRPDEAWIMYQATLEKQSELRIYPQKPEQLTQGNLSGMYKTVIPANSQVIIKIKKELPQAAEFIQLNLVSPYFDVTDMKLQNQALDFTFNPIDTLSVNGKTNVRYALIAGEGKIVSGQNEIELALKNFDANPLNVYFDLSYITNQNKTIKTEP